MGVTGSRTQSDEMVSHPVSLHEQGETVGRDREGGDEDEVSGDGHWEIVKIRV